MEILLKFGSQRGNFIFDPNEPGWISNGKGQEHRAYDTALPFPFNSLFLKRWHNKNASAHDFLVESCGKSLSGIPPIFGWKKEGTSTVYVFKHLPKSYKNLYTLLESPEGEDYLTFDFFMRVVKQSCNTFRELGAYPHPHVYTDFSVRNLMYDPEKKDLAFIDLDSAWSYPELKEKKGNPESNKFDIHLWHLWIKYVLPRYRLFPPNPVLLPKTMVLSFAVVWVRAISLYRGPQQSPWQALELVCNPLPSEQQPLWQALEDGNPEAFRKYFEINASVDSLFEVWHNVFDDLINDPDAAWSNVFQAAEKLASFFPDSAHSPIKKSTKPVNSPIRQAINALQSLVAQGSRKIMTHLGRYIATVAKILWAGTDPWGIDKR